jgi:sensor histidine kinase YesM
VYAVTISLIWTYLVSGRFDNNGITTRYGEIIILQPEQLECRVNQLEREVERQQREIDQLNRRLQRLEQRLRNVDRICCGELDPDNESISSDD